MRAEFEKRTVADITPRRSDWRDLEPSERGEALVYQPDLAAASSRATAVSAPKSVRLDPFTS